MGQSRTADRSLSRLWANGASLKSWLSNCDDLLVLWGRRWAVGRWCRPWFASWSLFSSRAEGPPLLWRPIRLHPLAVDGLGDSIVHAGGKAPPPAALVW